MENNPGRPTKIYRIEDDFETPIGLLTGENVIIRTAYSNHEPVGHVEHAENGVRIFRRTQHEPSEIGFVDDAGEVFSHGLFEGGTLGWVDEEGRVVQAGLIMGEEDVGRIEGPAIHAGAGALLLLLLPDHRERERRRQRGA